MKKEIAEAWVADLRTNPKQATGQLYDGEGHCCLGRLCLVLGATFREADYDDGTHGDYLPVLNDKTLSEYEVLPNEIRALSGMDSQSGVHLSEPEYGINKPEYGITKELTELNDNGATFAEIADVIEKNWESL